MENEEEEEKAKNGMGRCLNRLGARVRGVLEGFRTLGSRSGGSRREEGYVGPRGLCRMPWAEKRGMKCGPAQFPDTENVRRIDRLYCGCRF